MISARLLSSPSTSTTVAALRGGLLLGGIVKIALALRFFVLGIEMAPNLRRCIKPVGFGDLLPRNHGFACCFAGVFHHCPVARGVHADKGIRLALRVELVPHPGKLGVFVVRETHQGAAEVDRASRG